MHGPLDVLREEWTGEQLVERSVGSHVLEVRARLEEMTDLVSKNTREAQQRQKTAYDRTARSRTFEVGEEVLVLLPRVGNPLKLEWAGSYKVIRKTSPVDYEIKTSGRRHPRKIVHINLMKKWYKPTSLSLFVHTEPAIGDEVPFNADDDAFFPGQTPLNQPEPKVSMGAHLSPIQHEGLTELMKGFPGLLSDLPGRTKVVEHHIYVPGVAPIHQKPYRVPYSQREVVRQEIQRMLDSGVITTSVSLWASPIVLVTKKDGTVRFCVDYRKVNQVAKFDAYPMPRVEEVFESIGPANFITTLDLAKGYWQILMAKDSREVTAFNTPYGLFEFVVMPFGLHTAPATFQRLMNELLRGCQGFAGAYLDDIVIFSCSWEEHLHHLSEVFTVLQNAGLTIKPIKCQFAHGQVHYLGHIIGGGSIRPDPSKVEAVLAYQRPVTKKDVRSFLGLIGYYRKFVPNFADAAAVLVELIKKGRPDKVIWARECEIAFDRLKKRMISAPVLQVADPSKPFILQTDASDLGLGAVLSQLQSGEEHPVAFASRQLTPAEKKYSVVEKECLAIVWALKHFRMYLFGVQFTIETDHQPLRWLHQMKNTNSRLTRWALAIQPYHFEMKHRPGRLNENADALSKERPRVSGEGNNPPPSP